MDFRVFSFFVWEIERKEKKKNFGCEGVRKKWLHWKHLIFLFTSLCFIFGWIEMSKRREKCGSISCRVTNVGTVRLYFSRAEQAWRGGMSHTQKTTNSNACCFFRERKKGKIKSKIFAFRKEENTKMLTRRADFERQWTSNICMP